LEFFVREDLNKTSTRVMAVFEPLKVVITNLSEGSVESCSLENNPEDPESGHRAVNFTREIFIEQGDFMKEPPAKYFRLSPGNMVRLKGAYIIKCEEVIEDENGNVKELHCTYVPSSKSGADESGIKVKGVIQWVSASEGLEAEIRIYDRLFKVEDPSSEEGDFKEYINQNSLEVVKAIVEPSLKNAKQGDRYQFMRNGYFVPDTDFSTEKLVFNKTVGLKEGFKVG
jgi:glutaminyl-tRNA synthetase